MLFWGIVFCASLLTFIIFLPQVNSEWYWQLLGIPGFAGFASFCIFLGELIGRFEKKFYRKKTPPQFDRGI
jgi:hypothetical protein